jgi:hypothetical protein
MEYMENDGDMVYVVQSCTNVVSDHRLTLRRRIENASNTDLEAVIELNSEKSPDIRCAPMLYSVTVVLGLTKL